MTSITEYYLDTLEVILETNVGGYPLDEYGGGTQSLATIAMYRANAKLNGKIVVLGIKNLRPIFTRRHKRN